MPWHLSLGSSKVGKDAPGLHQLHVFVHKNVSASSDSLRMHATLDL